MAKEHKPIVEYLQTLETRAYDTSRMENVREIAEMVCGVEGCNYTCRAPCEAMKFIVRMFLANDDDQPPKFREDNKTFREMLVDHVVANYG